jgi:hypothetical protein
MQIGQIRIVADVLALDKSPDVNRSAECFPVSAIWRYAAKLRAVGHNIPVGLLLRSRTGRFDRLEVVSKEARGIAPGSWENELCESGDGGLLIVTRLILGWRHEADRVEQPPMIEPVHPRERG